MAEDGAESKRPVNPMADDGAESTHPVNYVVDDAAESKRPFNSEDSLSILDNLTGKTKVMTKRVESNLGEGSFAPSTHFCEDDDSETKLAS
ncbi:unnamed protein product [Cochlearia groenlandica]